MLLCFGSATRGSRTECVCVSELVEPLLLDSPHVNGTMMLMMMLMMLLLMMAGWLSNSSKVCRLHGNNKQTDERSYYSLTACVCLLPKLPRVRVRRCSERFIV